MTQTLRIKEEAYSNMFNERAKECTKSAKSNKETLEVAQALLDKANAVNEKHEATAAELILVKEGNRKYKVENEFLREKLKVSAEKLNK